MRRKGSVRGGEVKRERCGIVVLDRSWEGAECERSERWERARGVNAANGVGELEGAGLA